eukprot:2841983-Amphidinium_carterae.2
MEEGDRHQEQSWTQGTRTDRNTDQGTQANTQGKQGRSQTMQHTSKHAQGYVKCWIPAQAQGLPQSRLNTQWRGDTPQPRHNRGPKQLRANTSTSIAQDGEGNNQDDLHLGPVLCPRVVPWWNIVVVRYVVVAEGKVECGSAETKVDKAVACCGLASNTECERHAEQRLTSFSTWWEGVVWCFHFFVVFVGTLMSSAHQLDGSAAAV